MLDSHDDDEERVFREHIRSLLFEYAFTHLTVDHAQFTSDAVSELLEESLKIIPLHDKNALRLPMDPWERLTELFELKSIAPYQEKFQITTEVSQYLKSVMRSGKGPPKTERLIKEFTVGVTAASHQTRMTSTLSLKSTRATPRPGSGHFTRGIPTNHPAFTSVPLPQLDDTPVSQSDLLNITWRLQAEEHHAVSAFLKSAASLSRPVTNYRNPYLDPHTLPDSPQIYIWREEFVPIFPRSQRLRGGTTQKAKILPDFQSMADLPKKIPPAVKVEEDDVDMFREHMRVVDGWQAFSSISSPPSLLSSQEDNVDQLFNLPSPDTSPFSILTFSKMEVPPIPRKKRIKGSSHPATRRKTNESLASFLLGHARLSRVAESTTRRSPEPSLSIVGQPSMLEHDDLDDDVLAIFHSVKDSDGKTIIMEETLTTSESLLMKLPILSAPNVHVPNDLFLPLSFGDFVMPARSNKAAESSNLLHQFLKKAKGLKFLNLTLSWTPFSDKERLPSSMQITGSTVIVDSDDTKVGLPKQHIENEVHNLLESFSVVDHDPITDEDRWTESMPIEFGLSPNEIGIILSRVERHRTSGVEDPNLPEDDWDSDKENDPRSPRQAPPSINPTRYEVSNDLDTELFLDEEESHLLFRSAKRQRLDGLNDAAILGEDFFVDPAVEDPHHFRFSYTCPSDNDMEQQPMYITDLSYPAADIGEREPSFGHSSPSHLMPGPFHPLSLEFESNEGLSRVQSILRPSLTIDNLQTLTVEPQALQAGALDQDLPPHHVSLYPEQDPLFTQPSISSHAAGLSEFLRLRARRLLEAQPVQQPAPSQLDRPVVPVVRPTAPPELYDKNTLQLPSHEFPSHKHLYFASIDLLQKNVLLRHLRSSDCAVDFAEREHLSGVDLILDANTSIVFVSLVSLASQRETLVANISEQSWRYRHILVVFEAYPISCSFKAAEKHDTSFNAYTPPAIKAMGRFRRDLSLMEACEKKSTSCSVHTAFADSVHEAALFTRYYGDMAEQLDGTLWGDRPWLDGEVPAEEESLATVPCMNHFAAYVILCQISVDDFLALSSHERTEMFAVLVGEERMTSVNECIGSRTQALESSDPDSNLALA